MRSSRRVTTIVFALALLSVTPVFAQSDLDAVKVDAAHHKVEFENDQVRVVRWVIPPGEKTANHSHPNLVSIYLSDIDALATTPDGKTTPVHAKAGAVAWRGPGTHIVENVGKEPMRGILVEPKNPSSSLPAGAQDEVAVNPKSSKVEFENEQVRVIRYHYDAGQKSPMHGHPDNVQIVLSDSNAKVTGADGKVTSTSAKAGEVRWRPATQHSLENIGAPFDGILVEMKGAAAAK